MIFDFNPNWKTRMAPKTSSNYFFIKKNKIIPYCVDFHEHMKL